MSTTLRAGYIGARRDWIDVALASAGVAAPVVFTATFLALEASRGAGYDRLRDSISSLEAGPAGWVQQVNFVVVGVLIIAFAVGLHRALNPAGLWTAGPAIFAVYAVGLLGAAAFPVELDAAGVEVVPVGHVVAGVIGFLFPGIALIVTSRRMAANPRWRNLSTYTLASGVALLAFFVASGILVRPETAPLHDYLGLTQRLFLAVWFSCLVVLALRLLHLARTVDSEERS